MPLSGLYGKSNSYTIYGQKLECKTSTIIVPQNQPFFNFASSNARTSIGVFLRDGTMDADHAIHDTCLFLYVSWHQKGKQEFSVPKLVYTICTLYTTRDTFMMPGQLSANSLNIVLVLKIQPLLFQK